VLVVLVVEVVEVVLVVLVVEVVEVVLVVLVVEVVEVVVVVVVGGVQQGPYESTVNSAVPPKVKILTHPSPKLPIVFGPIETPNVSASP
jgi:hypothetical protein